MTVLYTGVTNNLERRVTEHFYNRGDKRSFCGRYSCYNLVYYEEYENITCAIEREKEIKGWLRYRKLALIKTENPGMRFLNDELIDCWPPTM